MLPDNDPDNKLFPQVKSAVQVNYKEKMVHSPHHTNQTLVILYIIIYIIQY
jgi:hypothetical protein